MTTKQKSCYQKKITLTTKKKLSSQKSKNYRASKVKVAVSTNYGESVKREESSTVKWRELTTAEENGWRVTSREWSMGKYDTRGETKCTFRRKFGVMLRRERWENRWMLYEWMSKLNYWSQVGALMSWVTYKTWHVSSFFYNNCCTWLIKIIEGTGETRAY